MLSALGLARAIEGGELTPAQAVDLCADAIAKRESEVGAFVTLDIEAVRKAAQTPGLKDKPLRGLPVGLKDIFDTADMPTEYGSPIYTGHRPKVDAALVALIRRNGGTLLSKTVTTEFAHLDPGKTRNPRNLAHTPGGSSSGSAAGVAAGFFPIATGSQTGGSVIRPASFCGVAGFRPSTRRSRSLIAAAAKATSATEAANSPAVSRCHDTHLTPTVGRSRYEGLKPATPQ